MAACRRASHGGKDEQRNRHGDILLDGCFPYRTPGRCRGLAELARPELAGLKGIRETTVCRGERHRVPSVRSAGRGFYFKDPNGHVLELMTVPQ